MGRIMEGTTERTGGAVGELFEGGQGLRQGRQQGAQLAQVARLHRRAHEVQRAALVDRPRGRLGVGAPPQRRVHGLLRGHVAGAQLRSRTRGLRAASEAKTRMIWMADTVHCSVRAACSAQHGDEARGSTLILLCW